MEDYKEKLEFIRQSGNDKYYWKEVAECMKSLQELVDRATPKKPINTVVIDDITEDACPSCSSLNITSEEMCYEHKHCPDCGQALDWSK